MSILKSLFGLGKSASPKESGPGPKMEYGGYTIEATPFIEASQHQVCGIIREVGGEERSHKFIRVDKFPTRQDAIDFTFVKGKQIIEQMGARMFAAD
jgi:hypothetical protein